MVEGVRSTKIIHEVIVIDSQVLTFRSKAMLIIKIIIAVKRQRTRGQNVYINECSFQMTLFNSNASNLEKN